MDQTWQRLASEESPFVIWDGFGLEGNSGISRHGLCLFDSLSKIQRPPIILRDGAEGFFPQRLARSKFFWPRHVEAILKSKERSFLRGKTIFHGLSNFNVPRSRAFHRDFKLVLTVHDLIPLLAPKLVSKSSSVQLYYCLKKLSPSLDRVVCVSHWTESVLIDFFPELKDRTIVIPNGFPRFKASGVTCDTSHTRILSVSRYEKYKNFELLVKIARALSPGSILTLITNSEGLRYASRFGKDLMDKKKLIVRTAVPESELKDHYQSSNVYLQTSLFEGFCLPLAEALSHGVSCVYLEGSGMDEVAGKSIAFALPRNSGLDDWVDAIGSARERSLSEGSSRSIETYLSNKPSWDDAARSLSQLYAKLL